LKPATVHNYKHNSYICLLKKLTTILFLFTILCANTGLGELLKLPVFIHHYFAYHDTDDSDSLIEFLHQHYDEDHAHAAANNEHKDLPFKSHNVGFLQTTPGYHQPASFEFIIEKPTVASKKFIYLSAFYTSSTYAIIWQPPRLQANSNC